MVKKHQLNIPDTISAIFIAFVMMSLIFLLTSESISFYHITAINTQLLIKQTLVFISIFVLIILVHYFYKPLSFLPIIILSFLTYILVYMIDSPAYSLRVGALLLIIPFTYITVKEIINHKHQYINLYSLNGLMILIIITYFLFTIGHSSINSDLLNMSQISDSPIISDTYKDYVIYAIPLFLSILAVFIFNRYKKEDKRQIPEIIFIVLITLFQVISLSMIMVYRTKILYTSTYDFGIYAQMFYNMKNLNGMLTTLERSILLSHNAVHFSPIYYLMLPFYLIYPSLETLQVLQVVIVAIGVIPIYLISKHLKLNRTIMFLVITMYVFHPAIVSSSFYDLHENCFLPPLLLFVFYYGLKHQWVCLIISFTLTLMIKEDAGLYLVFIGLFFLFTNDQITQKEKIKHTVMSILLVILPLVYFYLVTKMLNTDGDGAMFWRYSNLEAYDDLGIFGMPLTLFQNPTYWLTTMFTPSKIYHLLIVFLCLGFIPLLNKRFSHYWLIVPLLIMNFSSTYKYQSLFGYQYFYGTTTLLVVMVLLAFKENQKNTPRVKPILSYSIGLVPLIFIFILGISLFESKSYYREYYQNRPELYNTMRETLENIPEDSKVVASGFLTPYLSNRQVLYDINYYSIASSDISFDYIILDNRWQSDKLLAYQNTAKALGYVESDLSNDYLIVFVPDA